MLSILRTIAVGIATCIGIGWLVFALTRGEPHVAGGRVEVLPIGAMLLGGGAGLVSGVLAMVVDRYLQRRKRPF